MPTLEVNAAVNSLLTTWYDRRNDSGNSWIQRYASIASISGAGACTFKRDYPLGPSFPPVVGQDSVINATYMGDYDMAIDNGSNFLFTWGDNRDSDSVHANQPDIRRGTMVPAPITS